MNRDEAIISFNNVLTIRNLAPHTITMYTMFLKHFLDWSKLLDVSKSDLTLINDYIFYLLNRGDSPSSINTCMCAIRYFYEGVLSKVYTRKQFPVLKFSESIPYLFSDEEIKELLNTDNVKIKLIILLGIDCGFRAGEVANLKIGDVDVKRMIITIRNSKRGKTRKVKLSNTVLDCLRKYFNVYGDKKNWSNDDYLFKSPHMKHQNDCVTTNTIHQWFKTYLKEKSFYREDITYHDLRHSFATKMLENGCDIFLLKKLLGHSSLASTSRYIHYTTNDVETSFSLTDKLGLNND